MATNESQIMVFVNQGLQELSTAQISFGLKLLVIFGVIFLFNSAVKTGASLVDVLIYIIAFFKWAIFKIMKKDV